MGHRQTFTAYDRSVRSPAAKLGLAPATYAMLTEAGAKWCALGKHWAARAEFVKNRSSADGLGSACRACKRRYQRDAYARRARRIPHPTGGPPPGGPPAPTREEARP